MSRSPWNLGAVSRVSMWSGRDSKVERYRVGQGCCRCTRSPGAPGVGTGTVSRQFPTNAALLLFKACMTDTRLDAYRATQ